MFDPETTDLPVLDVFHGPEGLLRLSQRLMDWYEAPISDQEIADVLGPNMVSAFRYAQDKLAGKVRKVTLEPAFCHSADVAFRAVVLNYPEEVVQACFLHDVVEDTSKSIADVPKRVAELAEHFPPSVIADVVLLTNRYQLIFKAMKPKVSRDAALDGRGLRAFRAALDVVRNEIDESVALRFDDEFERMASFLDSDVDLSEAIKVSRRDKKFTIAVCLERALYSLYVGDLVRHARSVAEETNGHGDVNPLVVKYMDLIDNVRTSEVSNRLSLYKLVRKAETVIDATQAGFVDILPGDVTSRSTIATLLRIAQIRLVDQIKLRRRALADNFAESRFATLVNFLADQGTRLGHKYDIPPNRVAAVEELEGHVRAWNQARASRRAQ